MPTLKATAEEKLAALCKPLDFLLEEFGFETAESLVEGNTRLTIHRRGVDTIDVSVEASERRVGSDPNWGRLVAAVTYFPNGDGKSAQYVYNSVADGGTLRELMNEFMHGPEDAYIRENSLFLGLVPELGKWDAHYLVEAKAPKSLVGVTEQIWTAFALKTQAAALPMQMVEGGTTKGTVVGTHRPLIYVTTPGQPRTFEGQVYLVVGAPNYGLARAFDVDVTSPNRAPQGMDFGRMNSAVKEVIRQLAAN